MNTYFYLEDSTKAASFLNLIRQKFEVREEKIYSGIRRYYDTFDWRLYNNNMEFFSEGHAYSLRSKAANELHETISLAERPVFASDLPQQISIQKLLKPVLQMRALSRIFSVHVSDVNASILDKSRKTITRINIKSCRIKNRNVFFLIKIHPLRGYENKSSKIWRWIEAQKIDKSDQGLFEVICEMSGSTPGSYSSKLMVTLHPELSVPEAVKIIHKRLLSVMQQNENGIIKDVDTEFLHDYRVSTRRIRTLYGQLKNVLPAELLKRAKSDYGALGKMTNRMRDIDVYLLNINRYLDGMPKDLAGYIIPFFDNLRRERVGEQKKLARFIKSKAYKSRIKFWLNHLAEANVTESEDTPVRDFACEKILNHFESVLSLGSQINPASPDTRVHKLRIECKKLRYLLEFFSSLFPAGLIPALIEQLKILQDYLGEFNDYSVQQRTMRDYLNNLSLDSREGKQTITALGFQIGKLNERQTQVRKNFTKTFKRFSGRDTIKILNQIKMADQK